MNPDFRESLERFLRTVPLRNLTNDELWARFRVAETSTSDYQFGFAVLLERCGGRVYGTCFRKLRNEAVAEEAFQEAFLALIASRSRHRNYADATNWLFRVAVNKSLDAIRKLRPANPLSVDLQARSAEGAEGSELNAAITALVANLPPAERTAMELMGLESLSAKEAAEQSRTTAGAVQKAYERGRAKLQTELSKRGLLGVAAVPVVDVAIASAGRTSTLPAARAAAMAETILRRAASPIRSGSIALKAALVMLGFAAAGGLTWAAWPKTETETASASRSPAPQVESVPNRNLRIFQEQVLPKQKKALEGLVRDQGGSVEFESIQAYDTRVEVNYRLGNLTGGTKGWIGKARLIYDTDLRKVWIFCNWGTGRYEFVEVEEPIKIRNPLTGKVSVTKLPALTEAVDAFALLPRDDLTVAEANSNREKILEEIQPYCGLWYRKGDLSQPCSVKIHDGAPFLVRENGYLSGEFWRFRTSPGQGISAAFAVDSSSAVFSPDRSRIDFPDTGDFWTREPVKAP